MYPQQSFDMIVGNLRTQGKKSVAVKDGPFGPSCKYRGPNGLKCAAGFAIPDEFYETRFEGNAVPTNQDMCLWNKGNDIFDLGMVLMKLGHYLDLVRALQKIHDNWFVDTWETGFEEVAHEFGLKYTPKKCLTTDKS